MPDLVEGQVVDGRYQVVSRLGSGGMADVYCVQDLQLGRRVALKLLHRRYAQDAEFVERFRREASSAAGLQHPNVVGIYDRGEWDGTYYIAMEYLEGQSLKDIIRAYAPLVPEQAISLTLQILAAARFAHQRGVIHRDIKPQNVMVDPEGRVTVTDFGIARAGASDVTETGSILGTAQYLSPEQAQGHAVTPASDLYAIGVVLYELLTGRVPFDGDSPVTIALKHVSEYATPPSVFNSQVSPELDAIVMRALEKDPAARYASADEFIAALEHMAPGTGAHAVVALDEQPPPPEEDEEERRRRRRRWIIAAIVLALLLAGAAAAYFLTRSDDTKPVPNVTGQQLQAASAVLANAGFRVDVNRVTNSAPRDRVLRQDPQPNTEAEEGSTVQLIVSDGPGQVTVPDVVGQTQEDAERELEQARLKTSSRRQPSETVPAGRVIETVPSGGTLVSPGSTVTLVVSSGVERVEVPNVVGQSQASAENELEDAGLRSSVTSRESEDAEPGTVLSQSPSGGERVERGATVELVIAREPTTATVPNVVGESQDAAASTLSAAGFTVIFSEQEVDDEAQDGVVLAQSPGAGTRAERGSRVTITVGTFVEPPPPPTTPTTTGTTP